MKKVAIHTLGCKLNFAETSTIGRQFIDHGFSVVPSGEKCDVFVLNTCSVTERADKECRQLIRRVLRDSPEAYVIVTGCYAQLQPDEISTIDGVDLVLGTNEKLRVFSYENDFTKRQKSQVFISCIDSVTEFEPAYSAEVGGRTRAFLKVQDGCDFNCSFCTIPLARGTSRSASREDIVLQAEHLVANGYKEIVLTGVNVGDYGKNSDLSLKDLLISLEKIKGLQRIRISSIEPNLLTREMVDFLYDSEKFCNHFHIPLQSGSDTILKRMQRRYLTNHYRSLIEYIRRSDPDAAIGADVIVGFPGETEKLFEETQKFLIDIPVSYLHVFTYSERAHTPAATYCGIVELTERYRRNKLLTVLSQRKRHAFYRSFIGKAVSVLFESEMHDDRTSGLTKNYLRVECPTNVPLVNQIRNVHITGVDDDVCVGKIMDDVIEHISCYSYSPGFNQAVALS